MSTEFESRTLVSPGELRADAFRLFESEPHVDLLLSAPGLLPQPPRGHARLARQPHQPLSIETAHAHRLALLAQLGSELDQLPHTLAWEQCLRGWMRRLVSREARVFHYPSEALFTRLISRSHGSILPAAPLTHELTQRPPGSELDVMLSGEPHLQAREWFHRHRERADDISADVLALIQESWAGGFASAEDVYYKVLVEYFHDTLEGVDLSDRNPMLDVMTTFQVAAYESAKGMLRRFGGVFLSDVVGLGKTYVAMALLRHLQDTLGQTALVVAPPAVCPAWVTLAEEAGVNLQTLSYGKLDELRRYSSRQVLVLDESHNFRNPGTQRYELLREWLRPGGAPSLRKVLLLSATPQNNSPRDVYHQLQLFPDDYVRIPYPGESLEDFFRAVEADRASLAAVLQHVLVRRTRRYIKAQYPDAKLPVRKSSGERMWIPLRFPQRVSGPEQCLRYQIERTFGPGLYERIIQVLAELEYPLHGIAGFIQERHKDDPRLTGIRRAGASLRGLYKVLLLKRLESSVEAFRISAERLAQRLASAMNDLRDGMVRLPSSEDTDPDEPGELMPAGMFHGDQLRNALEHDLVRVQDILVRMPAQAVVEDAKLARLLAHLRQRHPSQHRTLVFTQFADTAEFLYAHLRDAKVGRVARVTGSSGKAAQMARRFAPVANRARDEVRPEDELDLLITTDALSEGVNLQDADTLINYDLHWNPVRLIQRAGRIDRIGSEHDEIHVASFLPERGLESGLGLEQVLRRRIQEFLEVFGEDSHVLPAEEMVDPAGALDAYTGKALEQEETGATDDAMDGLGRHVERILTLQRMEPKRFEHIQRMRVGRRAVTESSTSAVVAARLGWYWGFWRQGGETSQPTRLTDMEGLDLMYRHAQQRDFTEPEALLALQERAGALVEEVREFFAAEARRLRAQRENPKLDPSEEWLLKLLERYRQECIEVRRSTVDRMIQWLLAGQYKNYLRPAAIRWRKEHLTGEAVYQQMLGMLRFSLRDEVLGEEEIVGVVLGAGRHPA
jgi:hypothetical protein